MAKKGKVIRKVVRQSSQEPPRPDPSDDKPWGIELPRLRTKRLVRGKKKTPRRAQPSPKKKPRVGISRGGPKMR